MLFAALSFKQAEACLMKADGGVCTTKGLLPVPISLKISRYPIHKFPRGGPPRLFTGISSENMMRRLFGLTCHSLKLIKAKKEDIEIHDGAL